MRFFQRTEAAVWICIYSPAFLCQSVHPRWCEKEEVSLDTLNPVVGAEPGRMSDESGKLVRVSVEGVCVCVFVSHVVPLGGLGLFRLNSAAGRIPVRTPAHRPTELVSAPRLHQPTMWLGEPGARTTSGRLERHSLMSGEHCLNLSVPFLV